MESQLCCCLSPWAAALWIYRNCILSDCYWFRSVIIGKRNSLGNTCESTSQDRKAYLWGNGVFLLELRSYSRGFCLNSSISIPLRRAAGYLLFANIHIILVPKLVCEIASVAEVWTLQADIYIWESEGPNCLIATEPWKLACLAFLLCPGAAINFLTGTKHHCLELFNSIHSPLSTSLSLKGEWRL